MKNRLPGQVSEISMQNSLCEVILIAGFLGAGKTTFLQQILSWPEKLSGTVILVNEFGRIGIDGELLEGFDTPVVEMANGCICCSLKGDLIRTLGDILERFHPKRLIIEATGVADPLDILGVLDLPEFQRKFEKAKVVTIVDADFLGRKGILWSPLLQSNQGGRSRLTQQN